MILLRHDKMRLSDATRRMHFYADDTTISHHGVAPEISDCFYAQLAIRILFSLDSMLASPRRLRGCDIARYRSASTPAFRHAHAMPATLLLNFIAMIVEKFFLAMG